MSRLVTPTILAILLVGAVASAYAAVNHLPTEVRASLERSGGFRIFTSVSAIPKSVRDTFAHETREEPFALAEPGAKWQVTDFIVEQGLPRRRLEAVAVSQDYLVMFYERGGRGHSYHVSVFRTAPDGAKLVWRAIRPSNVTSPNALIEAIQAGDIDDDPKYLF